MIFAAVDGSPGAGLNLLHSSAGPLTLGSGISVTDTTGSGTVGSASEPLTLNGTVTASAGQTIDITGSSVTNAGSGSNSPSLQANGGTLTITNLQSNAGGIAATNGSTLDLNGTWQNNGTISENASTINLGGTFSTSTSGVNTLSTTNGTVNFIGDETNDVPLTISNTGAAWNINGGTINGGTVSIASGTQLTATGNSTLTEVTLAGQLDINSLSGNFNVVTVTINQGLTLNNGIVQLSGYGNFGGSAAALVLAGAGTQTLGGTGQVIFAALDGSPGAGVNLLYSSAGPLTLGSGISVTDTTGSGTVGSASEPLTLNGTVTASAGQTIDITGSSVTNNADGQIVDTASTINLSGTWNNLGTLTSTGAATVGLGGNFTLANLGTYTRDAAGEDTYSIEGTLTLAGQTLSTLDNRAGPGPWLMNGGTIVGGTVNTTLNVASGGSNTLQNVTLEGTLNDTSLVNVTGSGLTLSGGTINVSGNLNFSGTQTLGGTGTVNFLGSGTLQQTGSSGTLTIGAGVTLDSSGNANGTISGNWSNDGTLESTGASYSKLTLSGTWTNNADGQIVDIASTIDLSGTWNNLGTLTSTGTATSNSTVMLGGDFTLANLGTYKRDPNGFDTFDIGDGKDYGSPATPSTLNLAGHTLDNSFGPGPWALYDGAIDGGTVNTTLNVASGGSNTLQNVTLEGTLNDTSSLVNVTGSGLTLSGGTINVSGNLNFSGTQTLGGTGTVNFAGGTLQDTGSSGTLTIGAGVTLDSPGNGVGTISGGTATLDNQGIIDSNSTGVRSGLTLNGNWSNEGTIEATNGSGLYLGGAGGTFALNPFTIIGSNGFIYLTGTFVNSGNTLALNDTTGSLYLLEYGTISGGTVTTTGSAEVVGTNDGGTLAAVTLAGTLDLASPSFSRAV